MEKDTETQACENDKASDYCFALAHALCYKSANYQGLS